MDLPIISDNHRQKKAEIILGLNRHIEKLKADIPKEKLELDGFRIITEGENLVILGGEKNGLLNGVYHFLEQYLDCRMYTSGTVVIPKRIHINLPEIHDYQIPAFKLRDVHYRDAYVPEYAEWHGLTSIHRQEMGLGVHSFERLAHPDIYFESHPEYYSLIDGKRVHKAQLCLSNKDLVDVVEANLRELMKKSPKKDYWGVGQNDNDAYCQCSECRAINEREGSQSGTILHFVNQIAGRFPDKTMSGPCFSRVIYMGEVNFQNSKPI